MSGFLNLYQAAWSGDRQAFDALSVYCRDRLHRFIEFSMGANVRRWTGPEDVCQDVMLDVLRRMPSFREDLVEEEFDALLFMIARRRMVDVLKRARERGWSDNPGTDKRVSRLSTGVVTKNDELRMLRQRIEELPTKYALVLWWCAVQGRSRAEAATILGVKEETIKKRLSRARRLLRERTMRQHGC